MQWRPSDGDWVLQLQHDWRGYAPALALAAPDTLTQGLITVDAARLAAWA